MLAVCSSFALGAAPPFDEVAAAAAERNSPSTNRKIVVFMLFSSFRFNLGGCRVCLPLPGVRYTSFEGKFCLCMAAIRQPKRNAIRTNHKNEQHMDLTDTGWQSTRRRYICSENYYIVSYRLTSNKFLFHLLVQTSMATISVWNDNFFRQSWLICAPDQFSFR